MIFNSKPRELLYRFSIREGPMRLQYGKVGDVVPGVVVWPSIFHIHAWIENRIVNRHETW